MNTAARDAYLGQMVNTASPARLLVLLYDRLALDVRRALDAQQAGDHAEAATQLLHAQEIVMELRSSLKLDAWEGAERLSAIYAWLHSRLVKANTSRDSAVSAECLGIVEPLAEAWREAALASAVS